MLLTVLNCVNQYSVDVVQRCRHWNARVPRENIYLNHPHLFLLKSLMAFHCKKRKTTASKTLAELNKHLPDTNLPRLCDASYKKRSQLTPRTQTALFSWGIRGIRGAYWLSGIAKWSLAVRGKEALCTQLCTHSNSISLAWAQQFSSAAALSCLEIGRYC